MLNIKIFSRRKDQKRSKEIEILIAKERKRNFNNKGKKKE